ncbi:MAG: glycosyltransferase family 39 protein [Candidatus Paceibacterota bacterium]
MSKIKLLINSKTKNLLIFLLLIAVAFLLRSWHYAYFPIGGETADENAWTLLGSSLIQEGTPASWSYFSAYDNYHYIEGVYNAPIVRPDLDHPPLFSLLPGTAHSLKADWLAAPSLKVIRLPLVILGAINVGIFWLVLRQVFTQKWALVGTSLFLTIPSLVFGSRLVVAENLLVTWILLTLLIIFNKSSLTKQNRWTGWLLALFSAAAVLTKVSGLIIPASLFIYGLLIKQPKITKIAGIGGLLGASLFALYGAIYNWPLFLAVLTDQSARQLGLATLQNRLFLNPALVRHPFFDGWKVLGLFASFWLLVQPTKNKKLLLVHLFTIFSLLFIGLTVGEDTFHGWYDFVLWPSLIISSTALLQTIWQTKNGLLVGLVWLLLLPSLRLALMFSDNYADLGNWLMRGIVLIGFLPLGWQALNRQNLIRKTMLVLFVILLTANLTSILSITHEAYWLQADFFGSLL